MPETLPKEIVVHVGKVAVTVSTKPDRDRVRALTRPPQLTVASVLRWLARRIQRSGQPVAGMPRVMVEQAHPLGHDGSLGWRFTADSRVYTDAPLWLRTELVKNPVLAPENATAVSFAPVKGAPN